MRQRFLTAAAVLWLLSGCTGKLPALRPPEFDPQAAAVAAIDQYDTNADGRIDELELKSAPGITSALERLDSNQDGAVTADEVAKLIKERWIGDEVGVMRVAVIVHLNGQPLGGATVTFEPEQFLSNVIHPGTGVTDSEGYTPISMAAEHMPHPNVRSGLAPGLYLVRISKETSGQDIVPTKYNSQTTLGIEIASRTFGPGPVSFDLQK